MSFTVSTVLALVVAPAASSTSGEALATYQSAEVDWSEVWIELEALRLSEPASEPERGLDNVSARGQRAGRLRDLRALAREERADPRGALLDAQLERHFGEQSEEPLMRAPSPDARPFQGPELWLAVEVMVPGPERTALAVEALREADVHAAHVRLAYEVSREDGLALRLRDARALQGALHANQQADWSALNYAHSLRLLDLADEADRVLEQQLERSSEPAALWNQRGLIALGLGHEREARGYLGRSLALGSSNAGVVLGRLALDAGAVPEARAHFRALVTTPDAGAWALRGWGLAQLPAREARILEHDSEATGPTAGETSPSTPDAPHSTSDR